MELDDLAALALMGDEEALVVRIEQDKRKMYGIAYAYLRNEADALEAIQETVCRVWMKSKTLQDSRYFSTWMFRILIRVCLDTRKKRNREALILDAGGYNERLASEMNGIIGGVDAAGSTLGGAAERVDMAALIQVLSREQRMVVILKYYRDITLHEIAELMDKPEGTVKTWLHKALKQLRRNMASESGKKGGRIYGTE